MAAALLQPGRAGEGATVRDLAQRFAESAPLLARAATGDAPDEPAHERGCLAAVRSLACMVQLAGLMQAEGLVEGFKEEMARVPARATAPAPVALTRTRH